MRVSEGFNYAVLDVAEEELFGCVYLFPSEDPDCDVDVSWWVVDSAWGSELERALSEFVPLWLRDSWRFRSQRLWPRLAAPAEAT